VKFIETALPGVILVKPNVFKDKRGFFLESFREDLFKEVGIKEHFVQANHSRSTRNTLRGLHYQLHQPQAKLVRVSQGRIFDVIVDIRKGSQTFGQWYGTELDDESMEMIYMPPGFAHGFVVLSETTDFIYQCSDYYHPQSEQGIAWNDPDIGIEWPITDVVLSDKDKMHPTLADLAPDKLPEYQ
jgi:dTDP-4-dehydrorhamnose 3,5-epimerase